MGRSNSIDEQQKLNDKFREYVNQIRVDLDKSVTTEQSALEARIKEHYAKLNDDSSLLSSNYRHLTTASEWSLTAVNTMIAQCRDAIFGAKAPPGVKQDVPTPEVSNSIKTMTNLNLLIANAAFDVVQGLLVSLGSKTSTGVSAKSDMKPLAPGLKLFITVLENTYHRQDFFQNDSIVQNVFIFDCRFSVKEVKAESKFSDSQYYEDQKTAIRNQMAAVVKSIEKLDPTADDYPLLVAKYWKIAEVWNTQLGAIDEKLQGIARADGARVHVPALYALPGEDADVRDRQAILGQINSFLLTAQGRAR